MIASGGQASCRTPRASGAKRLECPLGIGALAEIEQSDFTRTRYIGVVPARLLRPAPCALMPQLTTAAAVTFLWPEQLWLALLLPFLAMFYVWLVQPPTLSREDVVASIDRFQLQRGTAIGSGIVIALATIFPRGGIDLSQLTGDRNLTPPLAAESAQDRK